MRKWENLGEHASRVRKCDQPMGGVTLLLAGDPGQGTPIVTERFQQKRVM